MTEVKDDEAEAALKESTRRFGQAISLRGLGPDFLPQAAELCEAVATMPPRRLDPEVAAYHVLLELERDGEYATLCRRDAADTSRDPRCGRRTLRAFERWVKRDPYLVHAGSNRNSAIFLRAAHVLRDARVAASTRSVKQEQEQLRGLQMSARCIVGAMLCREEARGIWLDLSKCDCDGNPARVLLEEAFAAHRENTAAEPNPECSQECVSDRESLEQYVLGAYRLLPLADYLRHEADADSGKQPRQQDDIDTLYLAHSLSAAKRDHDGLKATAMEKVMRLVAYGAVGYQLFNYYADIVSDIAVLRTLASTGRRVFLFMSLLFMVGSVVIACVFDALPFLHSRRQTKAAVPWGKLGWLALQNVTFTRMFFETHNALHFMRRNYLPPPSFDAAKMAEGLFETVPQSFLQTYLAVELLFAREPIPGSIALSVPISFLTLGVTITTLGDVKERNVLWSAIFFLYVVAHAAMRTLTFCGVFAYVLADTGGFADAGKLARMGTNFSIVLGSYSMCVASMFFSGHSLKSANTYCFALVKLLIPVDVDRFETLKNAEPRPPHVGFLLWRITEVVVFGAVFIAAAPARTATDAAASLGGSWLEPEVGSLALPDDPSELYTYLVLAVLLLLWLWTLLLVVPYEKGEAASKRISDVFRLARVKVDADGQGESP